MKIVERLLGVEKYNSKICKRVNGETAELV